MCDFHLALAQAPSDLTSKLARLKWLEAQLPDIAASGTDLVHLPELFACGYGIGDQIHSWAEPRGGKTARALACLARQFSIATHSGYVERDGDMLYNSASCIGPDGGELVHQRKLAIPPGFELNYCSAGQGCNLFTCKGFKIATLICYDDEFSETVRHVAAQGADFVLVPTELGAGWDWVAEKMMPASAFENGVFFAYANGVGMQGEITFLGKSVIAGLAGTELTRAGSDPEILHAALDLPFVAKAHSRLPYLADRG